MRLVFRRLNLQMYSLVHNLTYILMRRDIQGRDTDYLELLRVERHQGFLILKNYLPKIVSPGESRSLPSP